MIYELDQSEYGRVKDLFLPFEGFQPFCMAVLAGVHPGRVFVDDLDHPRTAFLNHDDPWCYLAGDPANNTFNHALNDAIWKRKAIQDGVPVLLITCASSDWDAQVAAIFAPREPVAGLRRRYICRQARDDGRADVPKGFVVRQMDASLLDFDLACEAREFIERCRDAASPDFHDYGFVAIDEATNQVVSWATVDAVTGGVGDVGLHTLPGYRRRGLATVTTAAALAHGLANGLTSIVWTCAEGNVPSLRTAEKLGLAREADYTMYFTAFDEIEHLSMQAYRDLESCRYAQASGLYDRIFELGQDQPSFMYHEAARAWAGAGDGARALRCLSRAVDKGWAAFEETTQSPEFVDLIDTPDWQAVLKGQCLQA